MMSCVSVSLGIGILHCVGAARLPPPPQPHRGLSAGGAGSRGATGARNGHTTALSACECQSFLDNVIAGLRQIGAWNAVATRYTRAPSTLFEPSLSLRRLRTTPARKPRTECCCQPVACIMAAIVAPAGDCSMAMTRDCFEPGSAFFPLGSIVVCCEGFAAPPAAADDAGERFFTDFDMEILRSVKAASRRITEAPPRPSGRRGKISERPHLPAFTTPPPQTRPTARSFLVTMI